MIMKGLISARLLPDEYCLGHIGRNMLINGLGEEAWFEASMNRYLEIGNAPKPMRSNHARVAVMARCGGLPVSDYLEAATMIPFVRVISRTGSMGDARGHRLHFNLYGEPFFLRRGLMPRYCQHCASEDTRRRGYAYWRRSHQRPGAVVCQRHRQPLLECSDRFAFARVPGATDGKSLYLMAQAADTEAVQQFDSQLDYWSSIHATGYMEAAAEDVQARLGSLDSLHVRDALSDLFEEVFPSKWLDHLYRWQKQSFSQRKNNNRFAGWNFNSVLGLILIKVSMRMAGEEFALSV